MNKESNKELYDKLEQLEKLESELLDFGHKMLIADNGNVFPVDLIASGAIKRTLSNINGFIILVHNQNMITARSLLRIQIDTFMRFSALWLVDDPQELAGRMIAGEHIRNIKDKNGKKMTDRYLVDTLSSKYNWLDTVYKNLSGYIHFSDKHLFSTVQEVNSEAQSIELLISSQDKYPERSWIELVDCFSESIKIFLSYLYGWIESKSTRG